MKNIIKTTAYSAVALSSVAFAWAIDFGEDKAKEFAWDGGTGGMTLMQMISNILTFILMFTWIIAVVFAVYGGFKIMTAAWDEDKVKKGKTTLINSLIGIFVVLIAYTLVGWIFTEADTLSGGAGI